jgi:drug/metabolite transporter (DMT)-like permease
MINLILTILCSTSIALILKYNNTKSGNELVLLMGNYFLASIITLILLLFENNFVYSLETTLFGLVLGGMFVYSFFAFAKAVAAAGTPLASLSSRLSVVIPVFLSVIIYQEIPGTSDYIGFAFAIFTIFLFYLSLKSDKKRQLSLLDFMYLFIVLAGIGLNDFAMKIFQQWRTPEEKSFFLFMIFTSAFFYTGITIFFRRIKIKKQDFLRGNILGIPNIFSSFFLIGALNVFPGIVVYPVVNIGIIVLTTVLAMLIWKERVDKYGAFALISGIVAIVLLNI